MINLNHLCRQLDAAADDRVIRRILSNGRCHSPAVRQRLTSSADAHIIATALVLQRMCELTYARCPMSDELAQRLINAQQPSGMFGTGQCIAATALAIKALQSWTDNGGECRNSINRGVAALLDQQDQSGLLAGDVIGSAIVLWQLVGCDCFHTGFGEVHCDALANAVRDAGSAVSAEFSRFAFAMAA